MLKEKTILTEYNSDKPRDWRGKEILSNFLYHLIDYDNASYLVQKCEIGDFYEHFDCMTTNGDWVINGEPIPDSWLDEHVADAWGAPLQGRYYE